MTTLAAHLPARVAAECRWRRLRGTALEMPRLRPRQVLQVWHELLQARAAWMRLDVHERAARLGRLAQRLRQEGPGAEAVQLARSAGLSTAVMREIWHVTLRPWNAASLHDLLRQERWGEDGLADGAALPQRLVHVLAGNVLPPTWSLLIRSWLLGAATWLRPASREPLFPASIVRRVASHEPLLGRMTAVTWWPHDVPGLHGMARCICAATDLVTIHGDDASIRAFAFDLGATGLHPGFVGFGSRWSAVFLGRQGLTPATAASVARDVCLFDQQGCLSPTQVFAPAGAALEEWAGMLAMELDRLQESLPRGEPDPRALAGLRAWTERMRLQQVLGRVARLWHGASSCVVLTQSLQPWSSPLDRHVLVQPFEDGDAWMRVFGPDRRRQLQGVAVAPEVDSDAGLREIVEALRPTYVCAPGMLQEPPPSWHQDHRPPLRSLLPRQPGRSSQG